MSKPEIVIERKIVCDGGYGFIIRESPDFPEGTHIIYRDQVFDSKTEKEGYISLANLDDLDALIECLQARRTEVKDYLDAERAKKISG